MSCPRFMVTLSVVGTKHRVSSKLKTRVFSGDENITPLAEVLSKELTEKFTQENTEKWLSLFDLEAVIKEWSGNYLKEFGDPSVIQEVKEN